MHSKIRAFTDVYWIAKAVKLFRRRAQSPVSLHNKHRLIEAFAVQTSFRRIGFVPAGNDIIGCTRKSDIRE